MPRFRFGRIAALLFIAITIVADIYLVCGLLLTHADYRRAPSGDYAFLPFTTNGMFSANSMFVWGVTAWTLTLALIASAGPVFAAKQTRCRKCGDILRGLREPRCPECGESI